MMANKYNNLKGLFITILDFLGLFSRFLSLTGKIVEKKRLQTS